MTTLPKTEQLADTVPGCSKGHAAPEGPGRPDYKPLMRKPRGDCVCSQPDRVTAGDILHPSPLNAVSHLPCPQPVRRAVRVVVSAEIMPPPLQTCEAGRPKKTTQIRCIDGLQHSGDTFTITHNTPGLGSNGKDRQERDGLFASLECQSGGGILRRIQHKKDRLPVGFSPSVKTGYETAEDNRQVPSPTFDL
jgi:hypothetical protein